MRFNQFKSSDPITRTRNIEGIIEVLREHCEVEADKILDPEGRALLENAAHSLERLSREFQSYLAKEEIPWEKFEDTDFHKSADPWD